ncbi:type IX secretion system protein PorD [Neotamlana laminarinivorans]|uniref:DUF4835 family protein n=1 Tax=Neotamlana laminarinivorans TaxID=2883124 RepID=A0A9X1HWJ3_9FLAO|nr:DUF4835 family protein [Tamlana laminarinivorans]MCB4797483.1 DUF4835 family protein [Tamlana laminarinivorans]
MRSFTLIFVLFLSLGAFSQELNCNLVVNAQQTGNENLPIFKTLERQLTEFVNKTKWTKKTFKTQERINCNFIINVLQYSNESFQANLQVQSTRPVYGSSFNTPVYSFNDTDFNFNYLVNQNLVFNPNQFQNNLVSVIAYHIYMILALDADTFEEQGGSEYYNQAQVIVNYSQQSNYTGWKLEDGLQSRFTLINNVLSPTYKEYREVLYNYHRNGLDVMAENVKKGKEEIASSLLKFNTMNSRRPNSFILRTFFDAKADEIEQIFSNGPSVDIVKLKESLPKIAPLHSSKWQNIKF